MHPRTRKRIHEFGLIYLLEHIHTCDPVGHIEAMSLESASRFVITDSGGLQKEAYYANKRCAVIMPDTGWRELIGCGWNVLCSPEKKKMLWAAQTIFTPISS